MPVLERYLMGLHNPEISELFVSFTLRNLAISAVMVFSGAFLYELGARIPLIFGFFLAWYATDFLTMVPMAILGSRIGFKRLILLSQIPLIAYVIWFSTLTTPTPFILVIGALAGIAMSSYWVSHHTILATFSDAGSRGSEVGLINIGSRLAQSVGPLLGGLAIALFGFPPVFGVMALVLLASGLLLLRTPDVRVDERVSVRHLTNGVRTRDFLASFGMGADFAANATIWPLLLFTTLVGAAGLGGLSSLAMFVSLITALFVTAVPDGHERRFLFLSSGATIVAWMVRLLLKLPLLFVTEPLYGAAKPFSMISFFAKTYEQSQGRVVRTVLIRRMGILSGRILIVGTTVITGLYWPGIVLAALLSILPPLVAS